MTNCYGLLKIVAIIILNFSTQIRSSISNVITLPVVSISLDKDGFHRKIQYIVQFDYNIIGKNCSYIIKQFIPADIYISTDQLDDLKKLNASYPKFVNVELPTESSRSFDVLLIGVPKAMETLTLPIHFRYHEPSNYGAFVTVEITKPEMFLKCPLSEDDHMKYCFDIEQANIVPFNIRYTNMNKSDCNWIYLDIKYNLKSSLSAKIPVGNRQAYQPTLYITILLSWLSAIWIILFTYHIPVSINQKLYYQQYQHQHQL